MPLRPSRTTQRDVSTVPRGRGAPLHPARPTCSHPSFPSSTQRPRVWLWCSVRARSSNALPDQATLTKRWGAKGLPLTYGTLEGAKGSSRNTRLVCAMPISLSSLVLRSPRNPGRFRDPARRGDRRRRCCRRRPTTSGEMTSMMRTCQTRMPCFQESANTGSVAATFGCSRQSRGQSIDLPRSGVLSPRCSFPSW